MSARGPYRQTASRSRVRLAASRSSLVCLLALTLPACLKPSPVERAMSLARMHREEEGITLLRTDLTLHPDDTPARRLLIRLLAFHGDLPAAREQVDILAKSLPEGDPSAWIELGHALELVHQFDEAMAAYATASEVAPLSPDGPAEAGSRAARWGEWEVARTWLDKAIARGASTSDTWHTLGLVRLNLHDVEGAKQAYRNAMAADPKSLDGWIGLATVALSEHDWKAAVVAYDGALALRPGWGDGHLGRAWALARLGRTAEAKAALEAAEEHGADAAALAKQRAMLAGQ